MEDYYGNIIMWQDTPLYEWVYVDNIGWGEHASYINQVFRDDSYVYVAHSLGIDIISNTYSGIVCYADITGGTSSVYSNGVMVFIGTNTGIKYILKDNIPTAGDMPVDIGNAVVDYKDKNFYYPSSVNIKYIHGYNDILSVVTDKGISVINNTPSVSFLSEFVNDLVLKCFMTSKGELYYYINDYVYNGCYLYKLDSVICDWSEASVVYESGSSFLSNESFINDLFVTEYSTVSGYNTLFLATTSGSAVYDEASGDSKLFKSFLAEDASPFNILLSTSDVIISVIPDTTSTISSGKLASMSSGNFPSLTVIRLQDNSVYDRYTVDVKGRSGNSLLPDKLVKDATS